MWNFKLKLRRQRDKDNYSEVEEKLPQIIEKNMVI